MSRGSWGIGNWMLMILAAIVLAAYFGVMGPVVDALDDKIDVIEKKVEQRFDGKAKDEIWLGTAAGGVLRGVPP